MNKDELLEVWDWDSGEPIGKSVERKKSHIEGIPHEGVHLWILRIQNSIAEILFQQRAMNKDLYPDCLDITVGGHVPFGRKKDKIQKEAYEEIGIKISHNDLIDLGYFRYEERDDKHFHREFQRVYFMEDNRLLDRYSFVDGEVTGIYAVPFFNIEELLKRDFSFVIKGFNGRKLVKRTVNRSDFHPLLFAESMNEYMRVFILGIKEYINGGKVNVKMPMDLSL